mgnify:CR=1 FL=1|jgi:hypothetical protein|tara:strand:+ start:393 stop:599 length:207 start_codon:yes stop_codon:yes gene_type:complete
MKAQFAIQPNKVVFVLRKEQPIDRDILRHLFLAMGKDYANEAIETLEFHAEITPNITGDVEVRRFNES